MNEDQILDHPMDEEDKKRDVIRNLASGGKRFANYIIDTIVYYILVIALGGVMGAFIGEEYIDSPWFTLFFYLSWVFYYWAFEATTGKTVGKYITRTKIVKEDGSMPSGTNVLGRSFARLIPFDPLSFLGSPGKGWHDSIPKIYVINEN